MLTTDGARAGGSVVGHSTGVGADAVGQPRRRGARPDAVFKLCEQLLLLLVLIGVLLAAVAGTFTLAFGLGSREVARALSAGRYLRHAYRVGQEIAFGEVRGRITRIHSTNTMLDAGDGRSIRVPHHLLIDSIVTIYGGDEGVEAGPS